MPVVDVSVEEVGSVTEAGRDTEDATEAPPPQECIWNTRAECASGTVSGHMDHPILVHLLLLPSIHVILTLTRSTIPSTCVLGMILMIASRIDSPHVIIPLHQGETPMVAVNPSIISPDHCLRCVALRLPRLWREGQLSELVKKVCWIWRSLLSTDHKGEFGVMLCTLRYMFT